MNVAELERLGIDVWSDFDAYNEGGYYVSLGDATFLARRVIAAEKLLEALSGITEVGKTGYHSISGDWLVSRKLMTAARIAITTYREASK